MVRFLSAMFIASVSGVAAVAASLPAVHVTAVHLSESVSAVLVGTGLIVMGAVVRRGGLSK
jgi:hypothetical protein